MAKAPLKPCREIGCTNLTRDSYCETHAKSKRDSNWYYNRYKRDQKANSFYSSYQWQKLRALRLQVDKGLCQLCLRQDVITQADVVHHIIEIKDDWSKRLDLDNLESVCHSCHNKIHNSA